MCRRTRAGQHEEVCDHSSPWPSQHIQGQDLGEGERSATQEGGQERTATPQVGQGDDGGEGAVVLRGPDQ